MAQQCYFYCSFHRLCLPAGGQMYKRRDFLLLLLSKAKVNFNTNCQLWTTRQLQLLHILGQKHYLVTKVTVRRWDSPVWQIWHTFCHIHKCRVRFGHLFNGKVILLINSSTGFCIHLPLIWWFQYLPDGSYNKKFWFPEIWSPIFFLEILQCDKSTKQGLSEHSSPKQNQLN